jgi:hypothetical protein
MPTACSSPKWTILSTPSRKTLSNDGKVVSNSKIGNKGLFLELSLIVVKIYFESHLLLLSVTNTTLAPLII